MGKRLFPMIEELEEGEHTNGTATHDRPEESTGKRSQPLTIWGGSPVLLSQAWSHSFWVETVCARAEQLR